MADRPRVWHWTKEGAPEPSGVTAVLDIDGWLYRRDADGHWSTPSFSAEKFGWPELLAAYSPLTEVIEG